VERRALGHWFSERELEDCPSCGRQAAFRTEETNAVVCTDCGYVGVAVAAANGLTRQFTRHS
jgi:transcription initiation factor TFIIIB Brf1 subunit/transcription initiation factor TFIIB